MSQQTHIIPRLHVPELVKLAVAYYALPGNSVGGSLHVVLDDGNIKDSHLDYCLNYAQEKGDTAGAELARLLRAASPTQRKKVYNTLNHIPNLGVPDKA